ncbi:MAG: FkbM family methyltransferase [Verrucomicrobiota bacterium]|jgi:FkbM family methyltransferase|nr:FkbM family methyltransferase [Verrucomicrobiota bacterium]|tara:strand:+ start:290 stop:1123 length:834 start_codon:yes stop_codon:yes gene_type:complete
MLAEFFYCYLLRPWPLRQLTNWTIRKLLPKSLRFGDATIVLNPDDPVISGALFFGVYEKGETAFVQRALRPGMTVLDVGANVGYYTALAARRVGPSGRVIALEPDPQSFEYLEQTIAANEVGNVDAFQCAAADHEAKMALYISKDNRGDNRLYEPDPKWPTVTVTARPADDILKDAEVDQLDFIKIDVQGFEASVIEGLQNTLAQSEKLTLLAEFWPKGLLDAGSNPKEFLERLRDYGLNLHELTPKGELVELTDFDDLIARHQGRRYTNIVGRKTK